MVCSTPRTDAPDPAAPLPLPLLPPPPPPPTIWSGDKGGPGSPTLPDAVAAAAVVTAADNDDAVVGAAVVGSCGGGAVTAWSKFVGLPRKNESGAMASGCPMLPEPEVTVEATSVKAGSTVSEETGETAVRFHWLFVYLVLSLLVYRLFEYLNWW